MDRDACITVSSQCSMLSSGVLLPASMFVGRETRAIILCKYGFHQVALPGSENFDIAIQQGDQHRHNVAAERSAPLVQADCRVGGMWGRRISYPRVWRNGNRI